MEEIAKIVFATIAGGVLGGGAVIALIRGATENHLRGIFASKSWVETLATKESVANLTSRVDRKVARDELNQVGSRVNAFETLLIQVRESADNAHDRLQVIEERHAQQWERITERLAKEVIKPLERIADRMEKMNDEQIRQAEELRHMRQRRGE